MKKTLDKGLLAVITFNQTTIKGYVTALNLWLIKEVMKKGGR